MYVINIIKELREIRVEIMTLLQTDISGEIDWHGLDAAEVSFRCSEKYSFSVNPLFPLEKKQNKYF